MVQSTLVTLVRPHSTCSSSVRLTVGITPPSIWLASPSGLMIWPQSWPTQTRVTRTVPVLRLTSTSATAATTTTAATWVVAFCNAHRKYPAVRDFTACRTGVDAASRLPVGAFHDGNGARIQDVLQTKFSRVGITPAL